MSRCFSFPPPGYEPKYRIEDIQILKKEKHKEKKHKKEKEKKREGKEKRDKETSDGKHTKSKEKKEKHKDKKKDKDKGRGKHKVSTSDKKRWQETSEGQKEGKISNEKQHPGHIQGSGGEEVFEKEDKKRKRISLSAEKRSAGPFDGYDGEKIGYDSEKGVDKVSKSVQEFAKTAEGGIRESGNQLLGKISSTGHNKDQVRLAARQSEFCVDQKNNKTRVDDMQIDGEGFDNRTGYLAHTAIQNLAESVQTKNEGVHVPSEKHTVKKMEIKEKNKENGGNNTCGDVRVNGDRENKVQRVRKWDKEKKDKPMEKNGYRRKVPDIPKESEHFGILGAQDMKTPHLARDIKRIVAVDATAKKRKDCEANGILHVKDNRLSKLPRPTHCPSTQNGSSLRDSQTTISSTNKMHKVATDVTLVNKEQKFNGVQEAPPPSSFTVRSSPATAQNCKIVGNIVKSPHPDLEYLNKLLIVPEMEELRNIDDEDWLFSSSHVKSEKPNENADDTPQVWADALRIDSDGFCALPYVIPY